MAPDAVEDHVGVLPVGAGAAELGVEIGGVGRNLRLRVVDLIGQQLQILLGRFVRERHPDVLAEGHRPVAVHGVARVDDHGQGIDRGELAVADREEVGSGNLDRGRRLAVPVEAKDVCPAQPLHHPDMLDHSRPVHVHERSRLSLVDAEKRPDLPALPKIVGRPCRRSAGRDRTDSARPCRPCPWRRWDSRRRRSGSGHGSGRAAIPILGATQPAAKRLPPPRFWRENRRPARPAHQRPPLEDAPGDDQDNQ